MGTTLMPLEVLVPVVVLVSVMWVSRCSLGSGGGLVAGHDRAAGAGPAGGAAGDRVGGEADPGEEVGHRGAAVARGADDVDGRADVELDDPAGQLPHRDQHRARDVAVEVLVELPDVDQGGAV